MATRSFKRIVSASAASPANWLRLAIWPAATLAVVTEFAFETVLPAAIFVTMAFLLVAAAPLLPVRNNPVATVIEALLAGVVVALTGGAGSHWILLFPWLAIDRGAGTAGRAVALSSLPLAYLGGVWWADGRLPDFATLLLHGAVFAVAARYALRPWLPPGAERATEHASGAENGRADALIQRALALFTILTDRGPEPARLDPADSGSLRGARALARVLPLLHGHREATGEPEVTLRRFDAGRLVDESCRDWSDCAAVRGLDLQPFVVPSASTVCFGDPERSARALDLMLFAGCFAIESGCVTLRSDLAGGDAGGDRLVLTLQVSGRSGKGAEMETVREVLRERVEHLGGRCIALGSPAAGAWRVELPFDLESGAGEPPRRLARVSLHVTGDSPLRAVLEAYVQAEGAVLVDDVARADAILLAEPARDPETESRCQSLKERRVRRPVFCLGATGGAPAGLMMEADAVIPVPFTRDELVGLLREHMNSGAATRRRTEVSAPPLPARLDGREESGPRPVCDVLVAEDDAISARVVTRFLETEGCSVHRVRDGEEALEALQRDRPGLALLDMHMPGLGGVEVAERVRLWESEQGGDRIPLVALTASSAEEDRRACREAGMDDFLNKPVDREALREILERFGIGAVPEEKQERK